jgi:LytS/YehU family sensor histidine kinase
MLEAQIEPHFLFNTLAHVKRLYETDREAGARMMANLKAYLAVALPQMRATDSTLGRELDHVRAYLEIQQNPHGAPAGVRH